MRRLFFIAMIMGLCASLYAQPQIRSDHPRIFFNAETWPEIKAKAFGEKKEYLDRLLESVDRLPDNPVASNVEMPAIKDRTIPIAGIGEFGTESAAAALAWRFTGEDKYLEMAKKMLKVSVKAYTDATLNGRPVNWYSHSRINAFCAYDWIYEALSHEERRELIVPLVEHVEMVQREYGLKIPRTNSGDIDSGFYGTRTMFWYSGLAAHGDGYCDAMAAKHLAKGYDWFIRVMENRNRTAGDDGALISAVPGYAAGHYSYAHFNFLFSMLSSTGKDISSDYPMLPYYANWLWWVWIRDEERPDHMRHAGFGDAHHQKNVDSSSNIYEQLAQMLHFYKDLGPDQRGMIESIRDFSYNKHRVRGNVYPVLPFLVDEGQPAAERYNAVLEESPLKARHFETLGQIYMRSGFTPDATYCTFTAGAELTGHKHFDENNFTVYKYDHLALDTGCRALQTDYNLVYYYPQSVAHNVVLIHKPGEKLPDHWGLKRKDHKKVENYGGMSSVNGAVVKAFETNDRFTYIASDATACYGDKAEEAVRQFVFLYPDYIIVYDRVGSSDPSYRKEWLLHTQNEPSVKKNVAVADSRDGRLFCQTLLPKDAQVSLVGGPGKEFLVGDINYAFDDNYLLKSQKEFDAGKRGPYWGEWRLEVKPSQECADTRFLNVLTAASTERRKPVKATYVSDDERDGVTMKIDGKKITFWFNRTGDIGGEVEYGGTVRPLTDSVQKQSGFNLNF